MSNSENNLMMMRNAQRNRANAGQLIQKYCDTVLEAPAFDLKTNDNPELSNDEKRANNALELAKQSAHRYQNSIFKAMIDELGDTKTFCNTYSSIAANMTNATIKQWTDGIEILQQQTDIHLNKSTFLGHSLEEFLKSVQEVSGELNAVSTALGNKDGAFSKVIADAQANIKSINSKIAGLITGVVLSGLAIIGGAIIAIAGAVTGQGWAVLGGVVLMGVGAAGEVVSGLGLSKSLDLKAKELEKIEHLQKEQTAIHHCSNELATLVEVTGNAVAAAHALSNGWGVVQANLRTFAASLKQERTPLATMERFYLTLNAHQISDLKDQTVFIESQISSVETLKAPDGTPLAEYVDQVVAERKSVAA